MDGLTLTFIVPRTPPLVSAIADSVAQRLLLRIRITSVLPRVMPHEKAGSATSIVTPRTEWHQRTC